MDDRRPLISVPEDFDPQYRGADEDWRGESAFRFVRWLTAPVPATATSPAVPGVPRDLTGCSARGLLYVRAYFEMYALGAAVQGAVPLAGVIDAPLTGEYALELPKAQVLQLRPQDRHDARSRYVLRALLTDPSGVESWCGTVPVFVL